MILLHGGSYYTITTTSYHTIPSIQAEFSAPLNIFLFHAQSQSVQMPHHFRVDSDLRTGRRINTHQDTRAGWPIELTFQVYYTRF